MTNKIRPTGVTADRERRVLTIQWSDGRECSYTFAGLRAVCPCVLCQGLLCTTVCPSGTLRPLQLPAEVQMGLAEVNPKRCLPHRGQACSQCFDHCPVPGAIMPDGQGRPQVTAACTGCGLCEYYCPTEPTSIRVRPRSAL